MEIYYPKQLFANLKETVKKSYGNTDAPLDQRKVDWRHHHPIAPNEKILRKYAKVAKPCVQKRVQSNAKA